MIKSPFTEPDLMDLIKGIKSSISASINCVHVGKVKSYDAAKATASIQIMVKRVFPDKVVSYPLLVNCPVYGLQGGTASVYMPIQTGDDCIVLFADRNIDIWHNNGLEAAPANSRCHDLADGIALVGIRSLINPPPTRASGEVGMAKDNIRISLASNKANIQNATTSLLKLITDFIDILKGLQVLDPISGALPLTAAVIAQLEAQKTVFAALLYKD
jgi:hypothetical protein